MEDKKGNLHCNRCGAFIEPDWESNADYWHYSCNACMSCGYIHKVKAQTDKEVKP